MTQNRRPPEITFPAEVLAALHRAAGDHEGHEGAPLLRRAGTALGEPVLQAISAGDGTGAGATSSDDFWAGLRDYLSSRGWGTISHERIHPGLGRVRAVDWAESGETGANPLTAGLLAGLFTALAGKEIDVLEAPRFADETDVAFLFGSRAAVGELRRLLADGSDLSDALSRL